VFAPGGGRVYMLVESGRSIGAGKVPGNTLWIYSSTDRGRDWSQPAAIAGASLATGVPDQPRLAIDPAHPARLFVFWRQIPPSGFEIGDLSGTAYEARSQDGGRTWSAPPLAPSVRLNASTMSDLPLPVSPVSRLRPDPKRTRQSVTSARSRTRSSFSTTS